MQYFEPHTIHNSCAVNRQNASFYMRKQMLLKFKILVAGNTHGLNGKGKAKRSNYIVRFGWYRYRLNKYVRYHRTIDYL